MRASIWTAELKEKLRELWVLEENGGVISTAEIARRLGVSKNAAISKAHGLKLAARDSPIRRHTGDVGADLSTPKHAQGPNVPAGEFEKLAAVAPVIAVPPVQLSPVRTCQWPIGDTRARDFRYCDEVSVPGRSYCSAHLREAFRHVTREPEHAG